MEPKDSFGVEGLLSRVSPRTSDGLSTEFIEYELDDFENTHLAAPPRPRWMHSRKHLQNGHGSTRFTFNAPRRRRSMFIRFIQLSIGTWSLILALILICGLFFPSYSDPPDHYVSLRQRALFDGGANLNNEKVFIAASLYDPQGELLGGEWAKSVSQLVDILGPQNVFLSIYENDPDDQARTALTSFAHALACQLEIVAERLDLHTLPHLPDLEGKSRLKRITFLAEVRNRALRPLRNTSSPAYATKFDKLLYLNDVIFDPVDAANLLLSTNLDHDTGKTRYLAACAIDFINPFKFYDTYATRDLEGYTMGVPFYPWFSGASKAESRFDVMSQTDAVRVKSCWGGTVAFEAKWFQPMNPESPSESAKVSEEHWSSKHDLPDQLDEVPHSLDETSVLQFRAENDTFWDASECCLIHADLSAVASSTLAPGETGIYLNPYIRVAYTASVLPWLSITKRFERLYPPIHTMVNWLAR